MTSRERYKQAFSPLHASQKTTWENIKKRMDSVENTTAGNPQKTRASEIYHATGNPQNNSEIHHATSSPQKSSNRFPKLSPKLWGGIAAACLCVLLISAAGADTYAARLLEPVSSLFKNVFQISGQDEEIANELGQRVETSVTSNGITITTDGIMADEHNCAVIFSVSREDGTKLAGKKAYQDGEWILYGDEFFIDDFNKVTDRSFGNWGRSFSYDEDEGDPSIQIAWVMSDELKVPSALDIHLKRLGLLTGTEERTIAEGTWDFHFSLPSYRSVRLLNNKKITLDGKKMVADEISVSPIGFYISIFKPRTMSLTEFDELINFHVERRRKLELKDGTMIDLNAGSAMQDVNDGKPFRMEKMRYVSAGTFDRIIDVEDMKSLHFDDLEIPIH